MYKTRLESYQTMGCSSYNNSADSHFEFVERGHGKPDWRFYDPRPGHSGYIKADRVWVDDTKQTVKAISFNDRNGEFCCAYTGDSYQDIWSQNRVDYWNKQRSEMFNNGLKMSPVKQDDMLKHIVDRESYDLIKNDWHRVKKENNTELYDEYSRKDVRNPYHPNNTMECEDIFVDKDNQVRYVRYVDRKENERYSYRHDTWELSTTLNDKIKSDKEITKNMRNSQVDVSEQAVKQQNNENRGHIGGIRR